MCDPVDEVEDVRRRLLATCRPMVEMTLALASLEKVMPCWEPETQDLQAALAAMRTFNRRVGTLFADLQRRQANLIDTPEGPADA